jgi:hypothetical protein
VEDSVDLLTTVAVYLPPKYTVKQEQLEDFYNTLRHQFFVGGDYNATILTLYHQRTRTLQNNENKQLKTPTFGRTHIMAI